MPWLAISRKGRKDSNQSQSSLRKICSLSACFSILGAFCMKQILSGTTVSWTTSAGSGFLSMTFKRGVRSFSPPAASSTLSKAGHILQRRLIVSATLKICPVSAELSIASITAIFLRPDCPSTSGVLPVKMQSANSSISAK